MLNCRQIQIWCVHKGVVLLCGVYNSVQEAAGGSPRQELKSSFLHQGLNKKIRSSCREKERGRERESDQDQEQQQEHQQQGLMFPTVLNCYQIQIWGVQKGVVLLCGVYNSVQEAAGGSPRQELKS